MFDRALALTERVPVTDSWAYLLVALLKVVSPICRKQGKMSVIQRWHLDQGSKTTDWPELVLRGLSQHTRKTRAFWSD